MSTTWWQALALMLLLEGAMPLLFPRQWQKLLQSLSRLPVAEFRRVGGALVVAAVVILWCVSA